MQNRFKTSNTNKKEKKIGEELMVPTCLGILDEAKFGFSSPS